MSEEKSLPKFRYATFCKMLLHNQGDPGDVSIISVMNEIRIQAQAEGELPTTIEVIIFPLSLFASFEGPKQPRPTVITTQLSSPDLPSFKGQSLETTIPFDKPGLSRVNININLDNFKIRMPGKDGKYTLVAKWKCENQTLGSLDVPVSLEVKGL
jgi:hypothetical protein